MASRRRLYQGSGSAQRAPPAFLALGGEMHPKFMSSTDRPEPLYPLRQLATRKPPPLFPGGSLPCLLQLVLPEQLGVPVGEQNLKRRVIRVTVALLYRTNRSSQWRLSVIHSHSYRCASLCVLQPHYLSPYLEYGAYYCLSASASLSL